MAGLLNDSLPDWLSTWLLTQGVAQDTSTTPYSSPYVPQVNPYYRGNIRGGRDAGDNFGVPQGEPGSFSDLLNGAQGLFDGLKSEVSEVSGALQGIASENSLERAVGLETGVNLLSTVAPPGWGLLGNLGAAFNTASQYSEESPGWGTFGDVMSALGTEFSEGWDGLFGNERAFTSGDGTLGQKGGRLGYAEKRGMGINSLSAAAIEQARRAEIENARALGAVADGWGRGGAVDPYSGGGTSMGGPDSSSMEGVGSRDDASENSGYAG